MLFKIIDGKNPSWGDVGHTYIDLMVMLEDEAGNIVGGGYIPFTAVPNDAEEHCIAIWNACIEGAFGEIAEYVAPVIPIEDQKQQKLADLSKWFEWASENAHVTSSLGFEIDADATAKRDIDGLITVVEEGAVQAPVGFMDYNNQVHPVTLSNLKTMRLEVIANGQSLYQQKWALRLAIESAETQEELDLVVIPTINSEEAE